MPNHGQTTKPGVGPTLTPHLVVREAARAIDFYRHAFGAVEQLRLTDPDGTILHAELRIGSALLYLNEESRDDHELAPETLGGAAASLHLFVNDVDKAYERALRAGATPILRVADMFWGERYGTLVDPFGYEWALATRVEALTPEEIRHRAQSEMSKITPFAERPPAPVTWSMGGALRSLEPRLNPR
jgi:PhnB protein